MVECDLAKVEVVGSNPISRSRFLRHPAALVDIFCAGRYLYIPAGRGTQVVRERSAKPLYVSSILTRASTSSLLIA